MTAQEVDRGLADLVTSRYPGIAVDLSEAADLTIGIEIREQRAAIYFNHIPGPGGLPVGSAESALALLSAGIDSPVASWQIMKRGCYLDFLTFHSAPYTPPETLQAVADIVRTLNQWQRKGALIACNLAEAQKIIRDGCTERFRTILYRRLMLRIAEELASQLGNQALVTGEAIGQVASQTIPNMRAIDDATSMLVLRPLVAYDKMDIIAIARHIGTLPISERGCADSCTVFAPTRAITNAQIERLREEEDRLDYPALMQLARDGLRRIDPVTCADYPFRA